MKLEDERYQTGIINHYQNFWNSKCSTYLFDKGPIDKLPYTFRVLEFPPSKSREMWTYATCCMSEKSDKQPVELHMFSKTKFLQLIELLTTVAFYHRTRGKIGLYHTVNFGKPIQENSLCSFGLVSLPYLDGPELENGTIDSKSVKFYWLIPITEKELEFKKIHGPTALEEEFDKGLNYYDFGRKSIF